MRPTAKLIRWGPMALAPCTRPSSSFARRLPTETIRTEGSSEFARRSFCPLALGRHFPYLALGMKTFALVLAAAALTSSSFASERPTPIPFRVAARMPDAAEVLSPSTVHLDGWLGARILANETNRLLAVDTEPLLAGFRHKPGSHPWIGEHV